jgi:ADP-heptose:LPS heptosyltransferase
LNGKSGTNHTHAEKEGKELLARLGEFDIAIDLRRHGDTRFLLSKISAVLKVGYKSFTPYDSELDIYLHTEIEESGRIMESDEYHMSVQLVRLVDSIPGGFIDLPKLCDLDPVKTQVAILPKAGSDAREWPIEYFVQLCRKIIDEEIVDVLNLYLPKDPSDMSDEFGPIPNVQFHIGLNMEDLIRSLIQNGLVITNNSFGGHIASYLGLPTIAIYSGHECVSQWGPAFGNTTAIFSEVTCAPCHKRLIKDCPYDTICLKQIMPDDVLDLVKKELGKKEFRDAQFESRRYFVY